MLNKQIRGIALTVSIFFLFSYLIIGCGTPKASSSTPTQSPSNTVTPTPSTPSNSENKTPTQDSSVKVTLYFPTTDAAGLVPIERKLTASDQEQELIKAIFKEFSAPPSGLVNPLPKETVLLGAQIKDGVVTLNLSKKFKNNFEGGATGEQMVLYSIINTMTSLPHIKSVEFLLEGEQTVAILGGLDTSTPILRNESLILKQ